MITTGIVLGGRYALGAPLGSGGMADVYEAVDRTTGDGVAVKVVRGVEPSMRKRIEAEARALERLDHPALVALRDVGEHDGAPFLVLDLVRGRCLADVLGDGPLGVERSVEIVAPVAEGLAHAHDLGIVHRDVKPANVLVDEDGRAHLADFGIARIADLTGLTRTGQVIGSASYLAPEQLRGDEVGPPADVFALGLVLLECITGRRAFDGSPTESAMARLVRSPVVPDDVPAWCRQLLIRMTAATPSARPTAAEVAGALASGRDEPAAATATAVLPAAAGSVAATAVHDLPPASPTEVLDAPAPRRTPAPAPDLVDAVRPWRGVLIAAAIIAALVVVGLAVGRGGTSRSRAVPPATTAPPTTAPTGSLPPALDHALDQLEASVK